MNCPGLNEAGTEKPAEAWTTAQVIDYFLEHFERGDFYIICPDNAVSSALDAKRIAWAYQDILLNRPPLSRWHPDWTERYDTWLKS